MWPVAATDSQRGRPQYLPPDLGLAQTGELGIGGSLFESLRDNRTVSDKPWSKPSRRLLWRLENQYRPRLP